MWQAPCCPQPMARPSFWRQVLAGQVPREQIEDEVLLDLTEREGLKMEIIRGGKAGG